MHRISTLKLSIVATELNVPNKVLFIYYLGCYHCKSILELSPLSGFTL